MDFARTSLSKSRPDSIRDVDLPRRENAYPSPADWRDEVIYFLLPDRFSDGKRAAVLYSIQIIWLWRDLRIFAGTSGPLKVEADIKGTLRGVASKLEYIASLGRRQSGSALSLNSEVIGTVIINLPSQGELIAWSRILDDEETLCIVNGHGAQ
jgi:hypothetical protein